MGADEERLYDLFELYGQFRETELILLKIKANGHVYFQEKIRSYIFNPTIINYYKHPKLDRLGDSSDAKGVYGHREMWEEVKTIERLEAEQRQEENARLAAREMERAEAQAEFEQEEEERRQREEARFRGEID